MPAYCIAQLQQVQCRSGQPNQLMKRWSGPKKNVIYIDPPGNCLIPLMFGIFEDFPFVAGGICEFPGGYIFAFLGIGMIKTSINPWQLESITMIMSTNQAMIHSLKLT